MLKEHNITLGKKDLLLMEEVLTMLGMLSTLSWLSGALAKKGLGQIKHSPIYSLGWFLTDQEYSRTPYYVQEVTRDSYKTLYHSTMFHTLP